MGWPKGRPRRPVLDVDIDQLDPLTAVPGPAVSADMRLSGIVRTTSGFAVAQVTLSPTGDLVEMSVGQSQSHPEFVAIEHKRVVAMLGQKVLVTR
jgi:hypothetical protein